MGSRERRRVRNLLQIPRIQVRWGVYAFFLGAFATLANQMLLMRQLRGILATVLLTTDVDPVLLSTIVEGPVRVMLVRMLMFLAIFSLMCLIVGIFVSHRIVGPLVPIRRQLQAMIDGKYGGSYMLRDRDELKDVMDLINNLSSTLEDRHGSGASGESEATPETETEALAA